MTALKVSGVSVDVDGKTLLRDVSLSVATGSWVSVIGPNGAGKTTLLRAICGLVPFSGQIDVDGVDVSQLGRKELARSIAIVRQSPTVPDGMTVFDYVTLGRSPHLGPLQRQSRHDREIALSVISDLHLDAFIDRRLTTMSGGELQRVFIARALTQEPSLLLLDEPTSALDIGHEQDVLEHLDRQRTNRELSIISTMHDLSTAAQYASSLLLLHHGQTVASGRPEDVLTVDVLSATYGVNLDVLHHPTPVVVARRPSRG